MKRRKKIGLLFPYNESWAGGLYYVLNIVNALKFLPDSEKPELIVFYSRDSSLQKMRDLNYPIISYRPIWQTPSKLQRAINKFKRLIGFSIFEPVCLYDPDLVDFLFPCDYNFDTFFGYSSLVNLPKVFWIPDFQHKSLPHFFSAEDIAVRDERIQQVAKKTETLVLSSIDAWNDYKKFVPGHRNRVEVIPFVSFLPDYLNVNLDEIKRKYGISKRFFISPNQFWAHKNHMVVLKAMSKIARDFDFQVVFTGKDWDHRNPGYFASLKKFVGENGLIDNAVFPGFIDRKEQLQLMKNSIAIIQPSLFEGWSTVVEDAKSLEHFILLSDIPVHREQCTTNVLFFDPHNPSELAALMQKGLQENYSIRPVDNSERSLEFARRLIALN